MIFLHSTFWRKKVFLCAVQLLVYAADGKFETNLTFNVADINLQSISKLGLYLRAEGEIKNLTVEICSAPYLPLVHPDVVV